MVSCSAVLMYSILSIKGLMDKISHYPSESKTRMSPLRQKAGQQTCFSRAIFKARRVFCIHLVRPVDCADDCPVPASDRLQDECASRKPATMASALSVRVGPFLCQRELIRWRASLFPCKNWIVRRTSKFIIKWPRAVLAVYVRISIAAPTKLSFLLMYRKKKIMQDLHRPYVSRRRRFVFGRNF